MLQIDGTKTKTPTSPRELIHSIGTTVTLQGAIYKIRTMSGFAFVIIRTHNTLVQGIYHPDFSEFPLELLKEEACVTITGKVVEDKRSKTGYEIHLMKVKILSSPIQVLPVVINNKNMVVSMDTLIDYRPITLRNEKERTIFKLQEGICRGFRSFLFLNNFTEIHTPKIVSAGAEGGANIFKLDYFGRDAYLAQSPQFYKQMMVGVYERVFEIAPVYRAEKHDTSRHLNEYISVDFEMGYLEDYTELMHMETQMLKYTLDFLKSNYAYELDLLKVNLPEISGIPAIRFHTAKEMIAKEYHREMKDMEDFEPEEEKLLYEMIKKRTGSEFVFITHYPSKKRPFYTMDDRENPELTLSFDLLFRGLEITTGGQRIHNYREQLSKLISRGMNPEAFDSYLMLHKYAVPPHGGLGLGLERFTSRLLEQSNVRYSCLFPRDINRLIP
ncbi:aspartate--tRNA(Asn) ligase [Mobilitalea sibirica]|uniref:Aspartate--tRNA ligase n=1 Tax=Mobilitalea sibirica TaxID=1462919 RepID=A0A8J7HBK6_9FIRM|nr:aspartate--tRNA(Asn) ligase [Mobilitalea sibirica]MBH1939334.1 aspartate--tRNA(Asn) ligase [Mobilitalea sibirica]